MPPGQEGGAALQPGTGRERGTVQARRRRRGPGQARGCARFQGRRVGVAGDALGGGAPAARRLFPGQFHAGEAVAPTAPGGGAQGLQGSEQGPPAPAADQEGVGHQPDRVAGDVRAVPQRRVAQDADRGPLEEDLVAQVQAEPRPQEHGPGHVVVGDIGGIQGAVAVEAADVLGALAAVVEDPASFQGIPVGQEKGCDRHWPRSVKDS